MICCTCSQNAILLEEERKEKECWNQIIAEAEQYKQAFYEKGKLNCETNKLQNREREKVINSNQPCHVLHQKLMIQNLPLSNTTLFIASYTSPTGRSSTQMPIKQYWKAIAKLITNEIANIEKRGKKEEQKPSQTKAWKAHWSLNNAPDFGKAEAYTHTTFLFTSQRCCCSREISVPEGQAVKPEVAATAWSSHATIRYLCRMISCHTSEFCTPSVVLPFAKPVHRESGLAYIAHQICW